MRAPRGPLAVALLLFAAALALRVLFAHAGPDAAWPFALVYEGDARLWLRHASALLRGEPFELGLPLRPPGTAHLVAWLWDGTPAGVGRLRLAWQVLGAAAAPATYLALRATIGAGRAALAGALAAGSSAWIGLASSVNSEAPYLLVALAGLGLHASLARAPGVGRAVAWGLVAAAGCLLRAEHAAYVAPALLHLAWIARRADGAADAEAHGRARRGHALRVAGAALAALVLALAPWHAAAWGAVARFNTVERPQPPAAAAALAAIEQRTSVLLWTPGALAERQALPAFARRSSSAFVAATVLHRGGSSVRAEDFGVLEEAFGARPRPLSTRFLVALYGPLNFALANVPGGSGGFDRARLERPPPLAGGADAYPRELVAGLPPPELAFEYPPHLALVNDGYRAGLAEVAADPAGWLGLVGRKLGRFLAGVGQGLGGFNLPAGGWDVRRAVDLAAPGGAAAIPWTVAVLALAAVGARRLVREGAPLAPWWLFLASKLLVAVAFYGYARQGAVALAGLAPLLAAGLAAACAPLAGRQVGGRPLLPVAAGALAVLLLALEVARTAVGVTARIDGAPAAYDPASPEVHADAWLDLRLGR